MVNISRPDFYVTGGTLRQDAASYVERRADTDLYDGLTHGEFCYVLTSRQMGKSSLMVHTAAHLREDGTAVAVLDLTLIGQNLTAEQWYDGLLARLGQQLDLEEELDEFWLTQERLSPLQRWLAALRAVVLARIPGRIVIFVDEIDMVRSLPFSTDEFFAAIRACYNRRPEEPEFVRLTFCLLGVATPSDLIQDTRTTPFNIGNRVEMTDFTTAEAAPLAQGLGRDPKTNYALLQRVLYWTGGHPYLTQRLCQALAADATAAPNPKSKIQNPKSVDRLCEALFLSRQAQEQDDNLLFVRERLLKSEVELAGLLDLYSRVRRGERALPDDTNRLVGVLRLAGIVQVAAGRLQVRNRIYAWVFDQEWITTHMPDAELRRQRTAYRRGLLRAAAIAGVVIAAMTGLVFLAVGQARNATRQALTARRYLYVADMNLARQAWENGNLRLAWQLLERHQPQAGIEGADLRGFEWRYLWRLCQESSALATLPGHKNGVLAVAFSPDGKILASGGRDNTVRLWDVAARRPLPSFRHGTENYSLAFSSDSRMLATVGEGTLKVWERHTGRVLTTLKGGITDAAFSPNGKTLAAGSGDRTVRLWDIRSGREIAAFPNHGAEVRGVAFSPDGKMLASVSGDRAHLWDVATRSQIALLKGHTEAVSSAAFSPDGKLLATSSQDDTVNLWDIPTGRLRKTLTGHRQGIYRVSISSNGRWLAAGGEDATVKVWDITTYREVNTLRGHENGVYAVAFSPDGETLATGSDDETVKLWRVAAPRETVIERHQADVLSVAFSPNGRLLAAGSGGSGAWGRHSRSGSVSLWDVAANRQVPGPGRQQDTVASVQFSPDSRILALAVGKAVKLWDLATRRVVATLKHADPVHTVAFAPDGKTLAALDQKSIRLWHLASEQELLGHGLLSIVTPLAYSPDGGFLASGGPDNSVKLWDLAARKEAALLKGHKREVLGVAFSPDGKTLASASDDNLIKLWDLAKKREIASLRGHTNAVSSLAFFPDGKTLASSGWDRTVKLWNLATYQEVATFQGPERTVWSVAVSPNGNALAVGSWDRTLRLWHAPTLNEIGAQSRARL